MLKLGRTFNRLLKHAVPAFLLVVFGALLLGVLFKGSSYLTKEGHFVSQPIAFSHKLHVQEVGLDCAFCHTQAAKSDHAGIPSVETCYGCHQQVLKDSKFLLPVREAFKKNEPIIWNRVNNLPDHVYFHHGKHVQAGLSCTQCHGEVREMPLMTKPQEFTMQWCLNCHRTHHPGSDSPTSLNQKLQGCYTCHR